MGQIPSVVEFVGGERVRDVDGYAVIRHISQPSDGLLINRPFKQDCRKTLSRLYRFSRDVLCARFKKPRFKCVGVLLQGEENAVKGVDVQRLCQGNGPAIMSVVAVSSQ